MAMRRRFGINNAAKVPSLMNDEFAGALVIPDTAQRRSGIRTSNEKRCGWIRRFTPLARRRRASPRRWACPGMTKTHLPHARAQHRFEGSTVVGGLVWQTLFVHVSDNAHFFPVSVLFNVARIPGHRYFFICRPPLTGFQAMPRIRSFKNTSGDVRRPTCETCGSPMWTSRLLPIGKDRQLAKFECPVCEVAKDQKKPDPASPET